jgi:hypothetical protein
MEDEVGRACKKRKAYRLLVVKEPPGTPRHMWVENIKKYILEVGRLGWCGLDWSGSG